MSPMNQSPLLVEAGRVGEGVVPTGVGEAQEVSDLPKATKDAHAGTGAKGSEELVDHGGGLPPEELADSTLMGVASVEHGAPDTYRR